MAKAITSYLSNKLKLLKISDPFMTKDSNEVLTLVETNSVKTLKTFSAIVKDLYHSLPQNELLSCVQSCIDTFVGVRFSTEAIPTTDHFLQLLSMYLKFTFSEKDNILFLQKQRICIVAWLAPLLSNLYLANLDGNLCANLSERKVVKISRFVNNF